MLNLNIVAWTSLSFLIHLFERLYNFIIGNDVNPTGKDTLPKSAFLFVTISIAEIYLKFIDLP